MSKERVTAFSDGVIAILITVMVLELKTPDGVDLSALLAAAPVFFSYVLSFVYIAIYWNNHHHFFQLVRRVDGLVLWANMHLLFWLSLVPFSTAWMGEHEFAPLPTAVYGFTLLMPALAWVAMQRAVGRLPENAALIAALGIDFKGTISPFLYVAGIVAAFFSAWIAAAFYVAVAVMWLVPDRRVERALAHRAGGGD
jgi:uncharacterized membrane protein